jgi:hypothetical protein
MGPPGMQPGTNPLTAFSAYQPPAAFQAGPAYQHPSGLEQNPFLMAAQAAQALSAAHLHSQLQAALSPALGALPPPPAPMAAPASAGARGSPRSENSAGASDQSADGETDDERRPPPPPSSGVAGMKVRRQFVGS